MDSEVGIKTGLYFVWDVFILIVSLIIWRIAFSLIAGLLIIAFMIPFGIGYGAGVIAGFPDSATLVISLIIGLGLIAAIGSIAARYGYQCPQLEVSFTSPD